MNKNMFKFEREGLDFPFYDNIKSLSKTKWLVLTLSFVVTFILMISPWTILSRSNPIVNYVPMIECLIPVFGFAYASGFKFNTVIKKLQAMDIPLIIIALICYLMYTGIITLLLKNLGIEVSPISIDNPITNLNSIIMVIIQLFGEEFCKLVPFLLVLTLLYDKTSNRKLSIVIAALVSVLLFGLVHIYSYNGHIIQILLIQGIGSLIFLFTYIKTKNILVSYIMHLALDFLAFILMFVGIH